MVIRRGVQGGGAGRGVGGGGHGGGVDLVMQQATFMMHQAMQDHAFQQMDGRRDGFPRGAHGLGPLAHKVQQAKHTTPMLFDATGFHDGLRIVRHSTGQQVLTPKGIDIEDQCIGLLQHGTGGHERVRGGGAHAGVTGMFEGSTSSASLSGHAFQLVTGKQLGRGRGSRGHGHGRGSRGSCGASGSGSRRVGERGLSW